MLADQSGGKTDDVQDGNLCRGDNGLVINGEGLNSVGYDRLELTRGCNLVASVDSTQRSSRTMESVRPSRW
jgi:hypothetical protein